MTSLPNISLDRISKKRCCLSGCVEWIVQMFFGALSQHNGDNNTESQSHRPDWRVCLFMCSMFVRVRQSQRHKEWERGSVNEWETGWKKEWMNVCESLVESHLLTLRQSKTTSVFFLNQQHFIITKWNTMVIRGDIKNIALIHWMAEWNRWLSLGKKWKLCWKCNFAICNFSTRL